MDGRRKKDEEEKGEDEGMVGWLECFEQEGQSSLLLQRLICTRLISSILDLAISTRGTSALRCQNIKILNGFPRSPSRACPSRQYDHSFGIFKCCTIPCQRIKLIDMIQRPLQSANTPFLVFYAKPSTKAPRYAFLLLSFPPPLLTIRIE